MICDFTNPLTFDGSPATTGTDFWNYASATCQEAQIEQISNASNTFYLRKEVSYGDLFVMFFLTVFIMFFVFDFLYRFIYKIKVNFRH
jgi:hypothetical protein